MQKMVLVSIVIYCHFVIVHFQAYYTKVTATNRMGSTAVNSDGVTILPNDLKLTGVMVHDGMPFNSAKGK